MSKKKILWIILLVVVIILIIATIIAANSIKNKDNKNVSDETFNKSANTADEGITENKENEKNEKENYKKIELSDGTLYSLTGDKVKADLVIGDKYFDTTISDMYLNPDQYYNKNIEIEGMYLANLKYTFVGRYSLSNLCAYCPTGYSYLEYQLQDNIDYKFTDGKDWIKVVGTLAKGNDETSNYRDYYYLKVISLEIMNERGNDTVSN